LIDRTDVLTGLAQAREDLVRARLQRFFRQVIQIIICENKDRDCLELALCSNCFEDIYSAHFGEHQI